MTFDIRLENEFAAQPYPLPFATISGARFRQLFARVCRRPELSSRGVEGGKQIWLRLWF